jgi:hypothetical protein
MSIIKESPIKSSFAIIGLLADIITIIVFIKTSKSFSMNSVIHNAYFQVSILITILFIIYIAIWFIIYTINTLRMLEVKSIIFSILYNKYSTKNPNSPFVLSQNDLIILSNNFNPKLLNKVFLDFQNLLINQKGLSNIDKEEYIQ